MDNILGKLNQIESSKNELKEKRRDERNIWWNKHWLKVVIISLIVFVISLIYNFASIFYIPYII